LLIVLSSPYFQGLTFDPIWILAIADRRPLRIGVSDVGGWDVRFSRAPD
jgi:hypothetical protein